jgi:cytochrome c-type biogenesis protein CcsB
MNPLRSIKSFLYSFSSMAITALLLLIFACAMAYATFVETAEGANAARNLVYNARWFEILFILLSANLIGSLIRYKTFHKRKWTILLFHLAFLMMILGAALTRYTGHEGLMHIRENMYSNTIVMQGGNLQMKVNDSIVMDHPIYSDWKDGSPLYKETFLGKDLSLTLKAFTPNAAKLVNPDPKGIPTLWIAVAGKSMQFESLHLQENEIKEKGSLSYSLGENSNGIIHFIHKEGQLFLQCKDTFMATSMGQMKHMVFPADTIIEVNDSLVYHLGWNSFVFKQFLPKGRIDLVSMQGHQGNYLFDAVTCELQNGDNIITIDVFGNQDFQGDEVKWENDGDIISLTLGPKTQEIPFSIKLIDFQLKRYTNSMSPSSFLSNVHLYDSINQVDFPYSIYMNHVLKYQGYRFFQSSYDNDEKGTILSVNYDPYGTPVTYFGYFLLALGMLLALFSRKTFFKEMIKKRSNKAISIIILLCLSLPSYASAPKKVPPSIHEVQVSIEHAEKLGQVLVADPKGRVKPINTLSSEILRKISRKTEIVGLNPTQVLISIMLEPITWESYPIIKVTNKAIREKYGFKDEYIALSDVMHYHEGQMNYVLSSEVNMAYAKDAKERTRYDKELLKLDERINLLDMIFSGSMLHIFPNPSDSSDKWLSPEDISFGIDNKELQSKLTLLFTDYYKGLKIGQATGQWGEADNKLDRIIEYQKANGKNLPSSSKIKAEVFYTKINFFKRAAFAYLISGLLLLILAFVQIFKPNLSSRYLSLFFKYLILIIFLGHTATLGLRWYISGHAPWSNGYETTLFIAWATVFAGLMFSRKSINTLALTSILGAIFILISSLSWMDPEITNLVPVLKSYWLIIHVAVITSSYGFFAIGFLIGLQNIIIMAFSGGKMSSRFELLLDDLSGVLNLALIVGLYLMTIGTFLGAVWANESWGRYWGWDPKETWALITVIIYTLVLHLRHIPHLNNIFVINAGGLLAFGSVLMTYFGVNYFLTGMHSYAGGDPFTIPIYAKAALMIIVLMIGIAAYNTFFKDKGKA